MRLGSIVAVVLAAWLLAAPVARAGLPETPRPRQFTVADGLPSNRVNAIAQDRAGYLWIATSDGLARFDGAGFRVWRVGSGLRDNFVWSVRVDAQDRVWIGTRSAGLAVLDAARERFTWYDRRTPGVGGNEVWSIACAPDGAVWFGTADAGLHRLQAGRVERWMPDAGLPDAGVRQLAFARDGSLWLGTVNGAARWTGRGFERVPAGALPSPVVNALGVDRDGTVWFGTARGPAARRPDGRFDARPWPDAGRPLLHVLLHDRAGSYWFDLPEGLGIDNESRVVPVPLYSEAARGLVRPSWVDALEDHEGGLWFASNASGLWYLPSRWRQFSVLSRALDDPATLANAQVRGIAPSRDGSVWLVGSGGVLDRFDSETGAVEHVVADVGQGFVLHAAVETRDGRVWATYPDGVAVIDPRTRSVRRWTTGGPDGALRGDAAYAIEDALGRVWLAGEGGVQARDPTGRVVVSAAPGDGRGLPAGATVLALAAAQGLPWVGTSRGVFAWGLGSQAFRPVPGVPAGAVYGIAFDSAGDAWIARFGAVERYAYDGRAWRLRARIGRGAGFPAIEPSGLTVDANGIAWVTSVRGLVRVDPASQRLRVYGVRDGLPSQEFADPPVPRPGDGRILAGTAEGLVVFDPAVVRPVTSPPVLRLERVDVARGARTVELDPARPFAIEHDDRDLAVRARLLSFNDASAHDYRFRLLGFDRGWVDTGAAGERVFSQLPPGDYVLQVIGRTADQVWSAPRAMRFHVRPAWWQTWWARASGLLAGVLAGLFAAHVYRLRLRRRHAMQHAEHERRMAEEASRAKTRFLATFGHEVRTPMTGVLGMTELLQDTPLDATQRGYVDAIRGAGAHLLRLLDDALDLARIDSGRLELVEDAFDLHRMLRDVADLVGPLARRRGLDFALHVADDVPRAVHGDCSRVRQILLNLLGNAQKFTERGGIALAVARHDGALRFSVSDTGPGLSAEQAARLFRRFEQADGARTTARYGGSGLGLAICMELAQAMDGRIGVDSAPGQGAIFHVDLPLREATLDDAAGAASTPAHATRPLSLLLVEDDATVAAVVAGLLAAQGHRVHHVAHGLAALAEAHMQHFDAAFLDLDLPGLDGFALARQLRASGFDAPLVVLTARADAESEPRARDAGFDGFLRKPVTGAMLAAELARVREGAVAR